MKDESKEPLTLSIDQAAKLLGIGRNEAYKAAHKGEIPVEKIGRRLLVPRAKFMKRFGEA